MTTRTIKKNLAGEEDILYGEGTVIQTRNDASYSITKVHTIKPVSSITELNALDTEKFTKAALFDGTGNTVTFYQYDAGSGLWEIRSSNTVYTEAEAIAATDLYEGAVIALSDRNFALFDVVLAASVTPNTFNIIQCTGINTLALKLRITDIVFSKAWGCKGDDTADDYSALQNLFDYAANNRSTIKYVSIDDGQYRHSQTLTLNIATISIIGDMYGFRQSGSAKSSVGFTYTGSTIAPAWQCNKNLGTMAGFNVANTGNATCWLELNSGAQNLIFERLYALNTTEHVPYTEAVIKCNGARIGYSQFRNIVATDPAPNFLLVKDSSTTGVTPITFTDRCVFRCANPFTVVKVDNSSLEQISFRDNTFIQVDSELTVVDTTVSPTANPLFSLEVVNNEFDSDTGGTLATDRYFKLENTGNIRFDGNHVNAGGVLGRNLFTLTNCSVTSCKGNYLKSFGYVFDADDNTVIRGVGCNDAEWSSIEGISNNANCSYTSVTQATVISLDGVEWGPSEHATYIMDAVDASAYTFALDITRPQNWEPGQIFTLIIKNETGGAIAAPLFAASTFNTQATAFTAPASNKQTSITFRFDGSEAVQLTAQSPDISV
jgi:hypothetical protein